MTDLTRLTAAETAAAVAVRRDSAPSRSPRPTWTGSPPSTTGVHAFLHVDADGALAAGPARSTTGAARASSSARWPACRSRSRTCSRPRACPTTCGSQILEGWRAAVRRDRRRAGCARPAWSSSARPTWTSSRWARRPRTRPTARRTTRGTSTASPAAPAAARPRRSPPYEAPLAIGTDTGGSIRQPAAVTGTVGVKPTYGGVSPLRPGRASPPRSTRPARAPAPCSTPPCCTRSIAGHDPLDSTSIDAPVPDVVAAARTQDVTGHADRRRQAVRRRGLPGRASSSGSARRSSCSRSSAPRSSRSPARTSTTRCRPTT